MKKIYFDLSTIANTYAGSGVYAWEVCHRLMRLAKPLQVIPLTCPFRTVGRKGIHRAFNAILRDTVWTNLIAGIEATQDDYFVFPNINVPRKFYSRKYAIVVHDIGAWHNFSYLSWRGQLGMRSLPVAVKNAHRVFTVSEYTARDVANEFGIPKDDIIITPNGLSDVYRYQAPILKEINGLSLPDKYFLHVGTFEPKKNLPFLLKVYERFRELTDSAENTPKLILTGGESWKSSDFMTAISNSPYAKDILILGKVSSEELPSLYRGATAFVFPSTFEGFGIPVIEALSQGTPVLINSNTSLTQFGEFGATVFDKFDVDIWAKQLQTIGQTRNRVPPADGEKVRQFFDWDRTAKIVAEGVGLIC